MSKIIEYFTEFSFVRYGLVVCILVSLCAALLGVTLVLKRYSYIGDSLSHVAFGAFAVAAVLNFTNNLIVVMPVTVIIAILLIRGGKNMRGDSALAMISVAGLSFGYLLYNKFPVSSGNVSGDVCTSLFGSTSLLTLDKSQVLLAFIMTIAVVLFYIIFYNRIFAVTFDSTFSRATGLRTALYDTLIAIITGVVISVSMRLVGSLLVCALVVFPATASMKLFSGYKRVVISSAIFGSVAALLGMILSILLETPVGATVVAVDVIGYFAFLTIGRFVKK